MNQFFISLKFRNKNLTLLVLSFQILAIVNKKKLLIQKMGEIQELGGQW